MRRRCTGYIYIRCILKMSTDVIFLFVFVRVQEPTSSSFVIVRWHIITQNQLIIFDKINGIAWKFDADKVVPLIFTAICRYFEWEERGNNLQAQYVQRSVAPIFGKGAIKSALIWLFYIKSTADFSVEQNLNHTAYSKAVIERSFLFVFAERVVIILW